MDDLLDIGTQPPIQDAHLLTYNHNSKRFVGFMAFFMLICSWGADTFSAFEVKDKILECFMYISVVGLGVTAAEKFGKK